MRTSISTSILFLVLIVIIASSIVLCDDSSVGQNMETKQPQGDTADLMSLVNALTKLQEAHQIDDHKKMRDKLEEILKDLGGSLEASDAEHNKLNQDETEDDDDEQGSETDRMAEELNKDLPPLRQVESLIESLTRMADSKPAKDEL